MRVLYVITHLGGYGSERHLLSLLQGSDTVNDAYVVCFEQGNLSSEIADFVKTITLVRVTWSGVGFVNLFKVIQTINPDIIHCHQPRALLFGGLAARLMKIPCIMTHHSSPHGHALATENYLRSVVFLFHFFLRRIVTALGTINIHVSHSSAGRFAKRIDTRIIYNWVDSKYFDIIGQQPRSSDGSIHFLYVGGVIPAKGIDDLIDFFSRLQNVRFRAIIAGGGSDTYIEKLNKRLHLLGLSDRVSLVGYQRDITELLSWATIFVSFSKSETFGLSVAEAMSAGLPVVVRNIPVMREIVPVGNVFADTVDDAISKVHELILGEQLLVDVGRRNREFSYAHYRKEVCITQTMKLYEGML